MEIIEIISYHINHTDDTIIVEFRTTEDSNFEYRTDTVDMKEADDFGFNLVNEDFDFFDEEDDDLELDDINEDELFSFLNEYYMIYPDRLPKKD